MARPLRLVVRRRPVSPSWMAALKAGTETFGGLVHRLPHTLALLVYDTETDADAQAQDGPRLSGPAKQTAALHRLEEILLEDLGMGPEVLQDHPELEVLGRQLIDAAHLQQQLIARYVTALGAVVKPPVPQES